MDPLFIVLLLVLIILTFWAINSYKRNEEEKVTKHFRKAKTKYIEPPRPHSISYSRFFRLASSVYSKQKEELAMALSRSIKEYIDLTGEEGNLQTSENLNLLINDPERWAHLQKDLIFRSNLNYQEEIMNQYIQILNELQGLLDIKLVYEKE
ncbi:MAG: hypothetical protein ACFFB2_00835 [Promethearchaeota archaeon]